MHGPVHVWGSKNLGESDVSFYHVGHMEEIQVIRLGAWGLYMLSHLSGSVVLL